MKRYLFLLPVLLTLFLFVYPPNETDALSGGDFKADRIIDDPIFFNGSDLTSIQLQAFLNAKMPSCDTWHAQSSNVRDSGPPYTCLKDYSQETWNIPADAYCNGFSGGTKSAAQIIYEVGVSCGVSQKVILVTLQKEQSLVTDSWPWTVQYSKATGFGCPDSALPTNVDANQSGCYDEYEGFFKQVYYGARQFKRYAQDGNIFTSYRPYRTSWVQYNPNSGCGGTNLYIQNQATSGLYIYTPYQPNAAALSNLYGTGDLCSAYGNRNFWRMFNDWFGSTRLQANNCDSKVSGIACVWTLMKNDGSQFLTSSKAERDIAKNNFGMIYEGIAFYAPTAQQQGTIPTYRLQQNGRHFYTADLSEYTSMKNSGNWTDEGVAFYAYAPTTTTNISHRVYRLYNSSFNHRYWTVDENKKTSLINMGYTLESTTFNSFSGFANLPQPANGRVNLYRVQGLAGYFYTPNLSELESVIKMGAIYEGVLTTASISNSGLPIYRLQRNGRHFYTASLTERNIAIKSYGMIDEGVGFYLDDTSAQVYRLANTLSGSYFYTTNINEVMVAANKNGWIYEGILISKNSNPSPIFRFLNMFNNRHFYTININEAARITNKGWEYETISFYANSNTGLPVYRLLHGDKHFYTANANEKDIAIRNFGYTYEGIAFYVNQTASSKPVYRLQSGNGDEYFYTAYTPEKDAAVSKFGYSYEGVGFYLP